MTKNLKKTTCFVFVKTMSYPYIQSQSRLKSFLTEISSRGIPEKITVKYLESIGYTSSNDRPIIRILKHVNLLDSNGTPNDNYATFRDETQSKQLMGSLVKDAYSELFVAYTNAPNEDKSKLDNWFKTKMGVGDRAASQASSTFLTLCSFASFVEVEAPSPKRKVEEVEEGEISKKITGEGIIVNLNIQLVLPATENVEVYEKIFKSLKKNILT